MKSKLHKNDERIMVKKANVLREWLSASGAGLRPWLLN